MVNVRFSSREQLVSCSNFLRFTFPGELRTTDECQLELMFTRGTLDTGVEEAVVERLLWAWMTVHGLQGDEASIASTRREPDRRQQEG
jgi:hypothetical protein